jgi:hypothetical protein
MITPRPRQATDAPLVPELICRRHVDTGGCRLQWFIISEGRKAGPYSAKQLSDFIKQNRFSLDDYVLAAGSKVARRLCSTPEALFPELYPPWSSPVPHPAQKAIEDNRTVVAQRMEDLLPMDAVGRSHPQPDQHLYRPPGTPAQEERLIGPSSPHPMQNVQPFRVEHRIADHRIADQRSAEPRIWAQKEEERDKAPQPIPQNKRSAGDLGNQIHRNLRKRMHQRPTGKLQRVLAQQKKRSPIPRHLAKLLSPAGAPSHQLPKASSEAQMRQEDNFTWAKNRVNPTAPKSIYQAAGRQRRRHKRPMTRIWSKTNGLIAGAVLILGIIGTLLLSSLRSQQDPVRPRFTVRKQLQEESPQIEKSTPKQPEETPKTQTGSNERSQVPEKRPAPTKKERNRDVKRASNERKKQQKKTAQNANQKRPKPRNQQSPKQPARIQTQLPARKLPASWPSTRVTSGPELARNKFKVVSIVNITLLQVPKSCQPCQIPGRLGDGTRVLLSSQSSAQWSEIIKSRTLVVNAKALVTQSAKDYYTLIIQELKP